MIMQRTIAVFSAAAYIGSLIIYFLGDWDTAIETLFIFMCIDFAVGLCVALFGKSKKTESGKLSSKATIKEIALKIGIFVLVAMATRFDLLFGTDFIRNGVIIALIVYETESIAENYVAMNWPFANILEKFLDVFHNLYKTKKNENGER